MKEKIFEGTLFFYSETGTEGGFWALQDKNFIFLNPPAYGVQDNCKVWDINDQNRSGITTKSEVFLNEEWLPLPDPICRDSDYRLSSLWHGEGQGDLLADKRLMERYGFKLKYKSERLDEEYGVGNWTLEESSSSICFYVNINDGRRFHDSFGTPQSEPNRPYGIPQNGLTRVTVEWNDGTIEYRRKSDTLLVESWSYEGLHILKNGDKLKIFDPVEKSIIWDGIIDLKQYNLFTEYTANGCFIRADQKNISREKWANYFFNKYPAQLRKNE